MRIEDSIGIVLKGKSQNKILSITPGQTVFEALEMMAHFDIGALLVCADDHLLGILSERDYAHQSKQTDILDVYGVLRVGGGWMLKICIDETIPEVAVVSFHPLEWPLRTNRGVLKP